MQVAPGGSAARMVQHGAEKAKSQQLQRQAPLAPAPAPLAPVPGAGRKKGAESRDSSDSSSSTSASEVGGATFGTRSTTSSSTVSTTTSTKAISKRHKRDRKKRRKGTRGKKEKPGFGHVIAGFRKGSSSSAGTDSDEDSDLKLWVFPATAIVLTILVAGAITLLLEPADNSSSSSSSSVVLLKSIAPKKAEEDCPCKNGKNNTTPGNGTTSGPGSTDAVPERPPLPEASTLRALRTRPEQDTTTKAVDDKAAGSPEDAQRHSGVEGGNSSGARLPRGRSGPKTRSFGNYRIEKGRRKSGARKAARTQGPEAPLGPGTPTTFVVGTVTTPEVNASRPVSAAESQPNPRETGASKASTGERRPEAAAEAQPGASTDNGQEDSLDEDDTEQPSVEAGDEGRLGEAPSSGGEPNATQTDSRREA